MKKISLAMAASLLLAGNAVAENSFEKAFKDGTVSGDITLHAERQNNSGSNKDAGFSMGSVNLGFETAQLNGFKLTFGFRGNHDFSEVEDGDFESLGEVSEQTDALLHTATISYTNQYFNLSVGRQEVDLEWLSDYHEAAVLGITAIPDTTVVFGVTRRIAIADEDAALDNFHDFGKNDSGEDIDFAAVLDVKYEGIEGLVLNPYFYDADNLAKWYGLKVDYDTDLFGVTLHGAQSDIENLSEDGEIYHLEGRLNLANVGLKLGYISTDKDQGAGYMDSLGDNISPFEDGNQVYEADADTTYFSLGYEIAGVELGALYGKTEYGSNEEKELNLTVDYNITESISLGALYVDVNAQDSDDDYNRFGLTLQYTF
ncbi:Opr family porin [Halarcobacter ebronensis]|uniref:Porin domain-containing protein n=1 Tax=Halarcobacter ebronensis TaxID=1462615 RepID=A0A4Q1APG4_9BACT|nr:Opr family porin [Halarcobacter ebronensis]QKF81277.1 hypothetical protein AEBR_0777 [Halarcobacter ebronensis]RXK04843.1 hypothetical protein CRV07_09645 [Halarcobacter ebronensis]